MSCTDSGAWSSQLGAKYMRLRETEPNRVYVTVLGANGSGKSAFTVRFLTQRFIGEYSDRHEGVYTKDETACGYHFEVAIKDTIDQDHLNIANICRWSHIAIVVYSIEDRRSFQRALRILEQLSRHDQAREVTLALVGNKTDLEERRRVPSVEALQVAREEDSQFAELSVSDEHLEPGRLMRRLLGQHAGNCQAHRREQQLLLLDATSQRSQRGGGHSPGGTRRQQKKSMELLRRAEAPVPVKKNSTPFKALKERFAWK